jgi:hypothetical protein
VTPGLVGREVTVSHRRATSILEIVSADARVVASHRLALDWWGRHPRDPGVAPSWRPRF